MIEPDLSPEAEKRRGAPPETLERIRQLANAEPKIRWSRQEIKQVAQQCALLYRGQVSRFTNKHFQAAQIVLPEARRKKAIVNHGLIEELRRQIIEVPLPPDPDEDTAAVHNGGYDATVQPDSSNGGAPPETQPLPQNMLRLPKPAQAISSSDVTEQIVAILVDVNLKSLALKGFTAAQLQEAFSNRIDSGRIRNLTIQANNSLTYFEELIRIAQWI